MTELDLIIAKWLDQYENRRVPTDSENRIEALCVIFKTLKEAGNNHDELSLAKNKILLACINPNHRDKNKLNNWKKMVEDEILIAIARIWPESVKLSTLTEEERNPTKVKIVEKPRPAKSEFVEEVEAAVPTLTKEEALEQLRRETASLPRIGKEMERSLINKIEQLPKPNIIWDEEMCELLGNDDER